MGNFNSSSNKSENKFENFYDIIDYIATHYILTMDFKNLSKLSEKAYCDKLVVLTSDIIEKYFNDMEITFLAQRIKNGLEVNDLKKENVMFINKDNLENLDISNDEQKSIKKDNKKPNIKLPESPRNIFLQLKIFILNIKKTERGTSINNNKYKNSLFISI